MRALISACLVMLLPTLPAVDPTPEMQQTLDEYRRLEELTRLVQREYVLPVAREELWAGAYRGMLLQLDAQSRFITKRELVMRNGGDSQHVGFGFDWRFDQRLERFVVARAISGGPASRAGMVRGDVIEAIDGVPITNLPVSDVREIMIELQDSVTIDLLHADHGTESVTIRRESLDDNGLDSYDLVDSQWGIGLIRLERFVSGGTQEKSGPGEHTATGHAFREAVEALAQRGLRALIIDLRGNPGGSLTAAVEVTDCFLDGGPGEGTIIVRQESRHTDHQAMFRATSTNTFPRWPLVVLIDEQTASSSEIVAAALRDHRRALLVGVTSAGKNSVQRTFLLDEGAAVKLTVARYRTPSGHDLSSGGIVPDVTVPTDNLVLLEQARQRRGETEQAVTDPSVEQAREILKGMLLHQSGLGL